MKFELRLSWYLPKKDQMVLSLMGQCPDSDLTSGVFSFESGVDQKVDALILISIRSHTAKEEDGRVIFHPNKSYSTDVPGDIFIGTSSEEQFKLLREYVLEDWAGTHPIAEALEVLNRAASIQGFLKG